MGAKTKTPVVSKKKKKVKKNTKKKRNAKRRRGRKGGWALRFCGVGGFCFFSFCFFSNPPKKKCPTRPGTVLPKPGKKKKTQPPEPRLLPCDGPLIETHR